MKRSQVEHVLRAAAAISQEHSADWKTRAQLFYVGDVTEICPEIHDLAVSKCVAARDKDADFIRGLLRHQMIEINLLLDRISQLDANKHPVKQFADWARRRASEAQS